MKKLISLALALVMILSLATVAFADTTPTTTSATFNLKKVYTKSGVAGNTTVGDPIETLNFTVTPKAKGGPTLTVNAVTTNSDAKKTTEDGTPYYEITGSVTGVTTVGKWYYTVTENDADRSWLAENNESIEMVVYVTWNQAHDDFVISVGTAMGEDKGKTGDTFTNEYKVASLAVKKTISGNAAEDDVDFKINVKFTSDSAVTTNIAVTGGSNNSNPTTIAAGDGWTEKSVDIWLKADETLTFQNVPVGVKYTVIEDEAHKVGTDGLVDINEKDKDYTATGEVDEAIALTADTTVTINNDKNIPNDTGIVLDSMPYIILLTLAAAGMFVLLTKKRAREF